MQDVSKWPVPDIARPFYKQVEVGPYSILVPATKLGRGQISVSEKAKVEAARSILKDKTALAKLRSDHKLELETSKAATKKLLSETKDSELKEMYANALVNLEAVSLLPETDEVTDDDTSYYAKKYRSKDEIFTAWIESLYVSLPGNPSIKELYPYIPSYILMETQDFFGESLTAPDEKSNGTPANSPSADGPSKVTVM